MERALDEMTPEEWTAYIRGGWAALTDVLSLLQTYEDRFVKKSELFQRIMDMRPRVPTPVDDLGVPHAKGEEGLT
jgi:hypothetical protein